MRKTLCIILSVLMIMAPLAIGTVAVDGTAISSAADFAKMDPNGTYYLANDITLSEKYATSFMGTLDGNGHAITTSTPIFETLNGATIKNLTIKGAVSGVEEAGTTGTGILARNSKHEGATLQNITNNATLTITSISGNAYVGALIGAVGGGFLTLTNCVNNGKITANVVIGGSIAPRFGGLTGNVAKDVVPVFINCVNNADITLTDTSETPSTGAAYLGGITSDCFAGTFINCTNNGNLTSNVPLDGAGICGRIAPSWQLPDHSVTFIGCVNNGDVITSAPGSRAIGGMFGYANGSNSQKGVMTIDRCVNTGKIAYTNTGASGNIGGLAGYLWGSGTNQYCVIKNSINTGDVTSAGTTFVSEFIGYSNSNGNQIYNNIGLGNLSTGPKADGDNTVYQTVVIGCSSANMSTAKITNNYVLDTAGLNYEFWTNTADNTASRVPVADAPAEDLILVTAAQVKSGAVAYLANKAAGENVFFQTLSTDAVPTLDASHKLVYKSDSSYSNTISCTHSKKTLVASTATCTDAGIDAHYECPDCGLVLKADGKTATDLASLAIGPTHKLGIANAKGQYTCEVCNLFVKGKITSETDFLAMAPNGEFELANDITVSATYADKFTGSIDGKGFTITTSAPLFAEVGGGSFKNLTIAGNVAATGSDVYAAALALRVTKNTTTTFENVVNKATVTGEYRTGGIIGQINNSNNATDTTTVIMTKCANEGTVTGANMVGGIVGYSQGAHLTFTDCTNSGAVTNTNGNAGGIIGRFGGDFTQAQQKDKNNKEILAANNDVGARYWTVDLVNCTNYGAIAGTSDVGGLVGHVRSAVVTLTGCTNFGTCTCTTADASSSGYAAGIIGHGGASKYNALVIATNCVNNGKMIYNGTGETGTAAGIVGYVYGANMFGHAIIDNCVNHGEINSGLFGSQFLGYSNTNYTTIKDSVGDGKVNATYPVIFGMSSADYYQYNISNVKIDKNSGETLFSWALSDSNEKNQIELNDYLDEHEGNVIVCETLYGDANGDGVVDSKDLGQLRKYMAALDYTTGASTVSVFAGADTNGDGTVDSKDLGLLRKYMAAFDYTTGTSTVVLGPTK